MLKLLLKWNCQRLSFVIILTMFVTIEMLNGFIRTANGQQISSLNSPPTMYLENNWRISENEPIGTVIDRVRATDGENDPLVFGLDAADSFFNGAASSDEKLPFWIHPDRGVVYLNESLSGRGGEDFLIYVTVSDGHLTAKTQVFVNILRKDAKNVYHSPHTLHNISKLFPPFGTLPGVPPTRNGGIYPPNLGKYPSLNSNMYKTPDDKVVNKQPEDSDIENHSGSSRSTLLTPVNVGNADNVMGTKNQRTTTSSKGERGHHNNHSDVKAHDDDDDDDGTKGSQVEKTQETYMVKAIMPIIITICGIFLVASIIALFVYRKRLCAIGKSLKKKSKEEMAKKSNQSNLSSNITDDSRNSMVMQHWNGPTAFNNRYVPWERDGQQDPHAFATSQLSTSSSTGANGDIIGGNGTTLTKLSSSTDRWEFPRHRLKFFNILGEGAFGQVWRCEATDIDGTEGITTVAVKTLKENATEIERNDLYSELQVMKSLEPHVNVVRLLGCCTDKDPIFVVIEYVNRGKLQTFLRSSRAERHYGNTHGKSNILTSGDLTLFMYQVARGMDFLTSRGIIHRDLAARNILITDDHTCKVADFGFARDVITSKIYERKSEGKLPIRWMAIESLYDNIFSVKSDIWSFGILMWEIVTLGSTPYPGISAADVMRKVRDGYRLEKPEHCRRELYNIMYYCWAKDPNERPSFSELVQLLDKLLHTEMDYIELERFPDHNYYNMLSLSGEKL